MRYKKIVPAHIERREEMTRDVCDCCGLDLSEDNKGAYADNDVRVQGHVGSFYPSGDCRTTYEIDLCSTCFVDKLVPLMRANGMPVREREAYDDDRAWDPDATAEERTK